MGISPNKSQCHASGNTIDGFALGGIANISRCSAISNYRSGISGGGACVVVECSSMCNHKHGIWLSLEGNIIRGNNRFGKPTNRSFVAGELVRADHRPLRRGQGRGERQRRRRTGQYRPEPALQEMRRSERPGASMRQEKQSVRARARCKCVLAMEL